MDELKQPLVQEVSEESSPEVSVTALEDPVVRNELDSSFMEVDNSPRTSTFPYTSVTTRGGNRKVVTLPVVNPADEGVRSARASTRRSFLAAGNNRFILEESLASKAEAGSDKELIDVSTDLSRSFINVHYISGNSGDTSVALEACKKTVLRPYYIFMKMIGWRRFTDKSYDLVQPWNRRLLNIAYPVGIFVLILISCVAQILTCFGRGDGFNERVYCSHGCESFLYASCKDVLITSLIVPSTVVLIAYVIGCYVFRFVFPENLANLTEKVFLDYSANHGAFSQKRLVYSLRAIMIIGMVWQSYAISLNVTRIFSSERLSSRTYIDITSKFTKAKLEDYCCNNNTHPQSEVDASRFIAVIFSAAGLILTDFFYLAAVTHYALECQLILFLMRATADRIRSQCWAVDLAIKEIKVSQDFLNVLNGQLSHMVSLLLFVFAGLWIEGVRALYRLQSNSEDRFMVIVTLLNTIQWTAVIAIPIVQAVRLTVAGDELETLGQELRTRPFVYSDAPQLDLDSFVMYTSNLSMNAKLFSIPMRPCLVLPALFFGVVIWRQLSAGEQLAIGRWF